MAGHLKDLGNGKWRAWFDLPRGEDGRRQQKVVTFQAKGRREADKHVAKLVADANAGRILAPTKHTVETYLAEWLEKRGQDNLSPKTLETWGDLARAYIHPRIGKVVLEKLTPKQVDDLYNGLLLNGRVRGDGGLSRRSVLHVHRLLSEALKHAVKVELIPRNPCDGMAPKGVRHKEREAVEEFDAEALGKLLEATKDTWLYVPIVLATGMGMRRGECLGLIWENVDFKSGAIHTRISVQQLRGKGTFEKRPKGERTRTAAMPGFVAGALRKHKSAQAAHRLQVGEAWEDRGFVVTDGFGNPRSPGSLTHAFRDVIEREGLPKITFHDLRHVNATLLLLKGVDVKIVSERLGHSTSAITRDLYQHVLRPMDQEAARATDDFFRGAVGG